MADILQEIVAHKRIELEEAKRRLSPSEMAKLAEKACDAGPCPSMRQALLDSPSGIIAEFKRKSPSKGWIHKDARPEIVPLAYQKHGAAALSILTDKDYFGGEDGFIRIARASGVDIPVLYKNFVIDEYQIFQARECGASAVLLIAACLSLSEYRLLLKRAHEFGLEVLLEMHGDADFAYAEAGSDMYGINNRNLGSFVTDVQNSFRLAERLPRGVCTVSESGISRPGTVRELRQAGFRGFLIGENFMRSDDPGAELEKFISHLC